MIAGHENLRANRGWMACHEREQPMSRGGCDDLDFSELLEFAKCAHHVPAIGFIGLAQALEAVMVHFGEGSELLVPVSAEKFLFYQFEQPPPVPPLFPYTTLFR